MTGPSRPAGVTARGFPYPGSAGIHANTPGALQALAEAITGQLTSVGGGGVILAGYVGVLSVSANNITPLTTAHFPALASITGMTVTMLGDPLGWLVESGVPVAGVTQQLRLVPLRNRAPAYSGNVTVYALAWGPPK